VAREGPRPHTAEETLRSARRTLGWIDSPFASRAGRRGGAITLHGFWLCGTTTIACCVVVFPLPSLAA
jgi:hypothetical protein